MRPSLLPLLLLPLLLLLLAACAGDDDGGSAGAADAALADALMHLPDAGPDAAIDYFCTPAGDHVEAADATNDPFAAGFTPEPSGQTAGAGAFTIGGCIDPQFASPAAADWDIYAFTLAAPARLHVGASSPQGVGADGLTLGLADDDANLTVIDDAPLQAGAASLDPAATLAAGTYLVFVQQPDTGFTQLLTYQLTVQTVP